MSFMQQGHAWSTGYAIPEYVRAEPPDRGVFVTKWMPRGTIPGLIPDFLAKPVGEKLTGRADVSLGADAYELVPRTPSAMGGVELMMPGEPGDPIAIFGKSASTFIMDSVARLPAKDRKAAMKSILGAFGPNLWDVVSEKAKKFETGGMPAKAALKKSLRISFANQLAGEILETGKRGKRPERGVLSTKSRAPLSGWLTEAVGGVKGAITGVIDGVTDLACGVVSSPLGPAAGAGVAAASGIPPVVGATGTQVAAGMCASDQVQGIPPGSMPQPAPSWILPAAIGGGVLLLVLVLK